MTVLGEVVEQTKTNQLYVALHMIDRYLNQGYSPRQIALIWNQGDGGECRRGTNKWGMSYDSCHYADLFLSYYN